jgi:hypothetical protein
MDGKRGGSVPLSHLGLFLGQLRTHRGGRDLCFTVTRTWRVAKIDCSRLQGSTFSPGSPYPVISM